MLKKKRPKKRAVAHLIWSLGLDDGLQRWIRPKAGVGFERKGQGILQIVHPAHGIEYIPVGPAQFLRNALGKWFHGIGVADCHRRAFRGYRELPYCLRGRE